MTATQLSGVRHAMDGWNTFSEYYCGQAGHYTTVSMEYGDYCSGQCTNGDEETMYTPIKDLVNVLEGMVTS